MSRGLHVLPVQTGTFHPGMNLCDFITESIPHDLVREKMILAITSKIVSLDENALLKRDERTKEEIVRAEADTYLAETVHHVHLTIKHGIMIPSAGIDESNSESGDYILFPKDPYASAKRIWTRLRETWKLQELGIIITDSHTQALRKGVTGIGLSHWGFEATRNLVGSPDLFGRIMKMTHINTLDALATAAVYMMGETSESAPLALIDAPHIAFTQTSSQQEIQIPLDEDLYGTFFMKNLR